MDDKINRQLTAPITDEDSSISLADELVHYGFISKVRDIASHCIVFYVKAEIFKYVSLETNWIIHTRFECAYSHVHHLPFILIEMNKFCLHFQNDREKLASAIEDSLHMRVSPNMSPSQMIMQTS